MEESQKEIQAQKNREILSKEILDFQRNILTSISNFENLFIPAATQFWSALVTVNGVLLGLVTFTRDNSAFNGCIAGLFYVSTVSSIFLCITLLIINKSSIKASHKEELEIFNNWGLQLQALINNAKSLNIPEADANKTFKINKNAFRNIIFWLEVVVFLLTIFNLISMLYFAFSK